MELLPLGDSRADQEKIKMLERVLRRKKHDWSALPPAESVENNPEH
jgi:hypothetical protein